MDAQRVVDLVEVFARNRADALPHARPGCVGAILGHDCHRALSLAVVPQRRGQVSWHVPAGVPASTSRARAENVWGEYSAV